MTPAQTRLARQRLFLGITNVGFWVTVATAGLFWFLANGTDGITLKWLGFLLLGMVAVQAGFDFVGGFVLLPPPVGTVSRFLGGWTRGALGHTLVLAGVGLLSYASFRLTGGFVLAIVLATAGLALARQPLLRGIGGVRTRLVEQNGETFRAAETDDPAFTGSVVGWGSRAVSLLPAAWLQTLPAGLLAAETARRRWQMAAGLPGRAVALVLGWNVLGTVIGTLVLRLAERPPAAALLLHACWMTLWTFGSLLWLPSLSRPAVFAADRAAREAGHDPAAWITRFPALVGEDGGANSLVQTIFYPVPSAGRRLERLAAPGSTGFVPGNLARSNLYYSWAACTLLGRAVHCNVGRPALWIFPPSA